MKVPDIAALIRATGPRKSVGRISQRVRARRGPMTGSA